MKRPYQISHGEGRISDEQRSDTCKICHTRHTRRWIPLCLPKHAGICQNRLVMRARVRILLLLVLLFAGMSPEAFASPPIHPKKGRFLVASRTLRDPNFTETVILLLDSGPTGALGVVINRPTGTKLAAVLPRVKALRGRSDPVFLGGPVSRSVMVLLIGASGQPADSEKILDGVYATTRLGTLREILARKAGKTRFHAYAGYAGWAPGQLENEIARGDWLVGSADAATIFDLPATEIWPKLIQRFSGAWTRAIPDSTLSAVEPS